MSQKSPYKKIQKSDCGELMTKQESRQVQLDMLNAIADYCDRHKLRYYLSGGTLLGAMRHKGFIPWDDDIDINMPRPDCEKLFRMTGGRLNGYVLAPPDLDGVVPCCESYRVYSPDGIIESYIGGTAKTPRYYPVFVDIFPIEGLPAGDFATKCHYAKLVFLRKMMRVSSLKQMEGSNISAHLFHAAAWIPAKLIGYKKWSRWIQRLVQKYEFERSEYVGVMTAPVHTTQEKVRKADYLPVVEVQFESGKYHAPANYDRYLTQLYGDYMALPPEEKRHSHHKYNMYWRKKEVKDF